MLCWERENGKKFKKISNKNCLKKSSFKSCVDVFPEKFISEKKMVSIRVTSGLYYKNILTIVSDNRKWHLYLYMCFTLALAYVLAIASIVNYDRKWRSKLWRHLQSYYDNQNSFIIQATDWAKFYHLGNFFKARTF